MYHLYELSALILGISSFVMGVTLVVISRDKTERRIHNAKGLVFFAAAMFVMAVINIAEFIVGAEVVSDLKSLAIVIPASALELFLILMSYYSLLSKNYVTRKKVVSELIQIAIFTTPPLFVDYSRFPVMFFVLLVIAISFYVTKFTMGALRCKSLHKQVAEQLESYYSEESSKMTNWIKSAIVLAFVIGIVSAIVPATNFTVLLIYNTSLFFAYLYIYILLLHNIRIFDIKMLVLSNVEEWVASIKTVSISAHVYKRWLDAKEYTKPGITADETALHLGVSRTKLSLYLRNECKSSFYQWIAHLRIEEAKSQLIKYPDRLIADIAVNIGIEDKSNFARTFKRVTDFSPQAYRIKFAKPNSSRMRK